MMSSGICSTKEEFFRYIYYKTKGNNMIKKHSFKLNKGEALEAIQSIATTTYRNLSGALEFLVIKGFKQHEIEKQILKKNNNNLNNRGNYDE